MNTSNDTDEESEGLDGSIIVQIRADLIPEGTEVRKVTGQAVYLLKKEIRVGAQVIKASAGTVLLLDRDTGNANAFPSTKHLVVLDPEEVQDLVRTWLDGAPQ